MRANWNRCSHLVGGHIWGDLAASPLVLYDMVQQLCDMSWHWVREPEHVAG